MVCSINDAIKYVTNCEYKYFLNKRNVFGVALGHKVINGINTNMPCLVTFVKKKLPRYMLSESELVPAFYKGITTDVVEANMPQAVRFTDRIRPVLGGYVIGPAFFKDFSGSLACLVADTRGFVYLLSCNHVMAAENDAPLGTPIIQPSMEFQGQSPRDIIARLSNFVKLEFITSPDLPENFVDCAIARVSNLSNVSKNLAVIGALSGMTRQARIGTSVEKVGASTELTGGVVLYTDGSMLIDYGKGLAFFKHLIGVTKMGDSGDSGSLLLDGQKNALGLIMATNDNVTMCNPIEEVLQALNVRIYA